MGKTCSFQRKIIEYILIIVSITLAVGTLLVVSLVERKLSGQNEKYTLSAFVKTDVELENQKKKMDTDFIRLLSALTQNGIPDTKNALTLPYTKSLINISNLFDEYLDYKMIGLFTSDVSIVCSPIRSFSVHYSSDSVFSTPLYDNILYGENDYGTAYFHEFIDDNYNGNSSIWLSKIIYFRKTFTYMGQTCYLIIGLDEMTIHQTFLHLEQGFNSVYVIGAADEILSSSQSDMFRRPMDYPIQWDSGQASYKKTLDGIEYQIIPYALNIYDWSIVNQYPTSEYTREVNRMSIVIVMIFIGCLIAVAASVSLTIHRISSPLNELSDRLKSFSATGLRTPKVLRTDNIVEFEILSNSFLQMADDIQRLVSRQKEEEEQKNKFRIQALMAQINPHFICNALNTVKIMAEISGTRNVAIMISHICHYISLAFRTTRNRWTYREEYAFLEDYIYILEICFTAKIEITRSFDILISDCILPRFLIQQLIENSISHGMPQDRTLTIDVSLRKSRDQQVTIAVSDNGIGFSPEELECKRKQLDDFSRNTVEVEDMHTGIGLRNIKQRLNQYYPECHLFEIQSIQNQRTVITIRIPLQQTDPEAATAG